MKQHQPTNPYKNKRESPNTRIRKATFAEIPVTNDEGDTTNSSTSQTTTPNKSNTTKNNNNTHKQKKQKQNNASTTKTKVTNNMKDKSKVTSYFAAGPARSNERVKNSRAVQVKNSKGRPTRKGSSAEITFNHKFRYDVNITLHATTLESRLTELQTNIDELMAIITTEDKKAKLLPWKVANQHRHPAITSSDDTTGSFADIYLSRSWLGNIDSKHRLYMKLYIGHDKGYQNILMALDDWNSHSDRQLKYCMIQAEETTFIGWFLYSTLNIDAGALADAIYDEYKVEVGLRWMDIRMTTQGQKQTTKSKPIKALHVETEKSKGRSIMEKLMKCYGRSFETTRNFPNGIRLRFCKNLDNAAYKLEKTKLINLRSRQKQLLSETQKTTSDGILDLDIALKEETNMNEETLVTTSTTTTLRDAIMDIQSKYVKNTPLFRSVDMAYNSEEYVFAYHQSMADEAKAMVDYLYPYLLHLYEGKALKKAFDAVHIKEMTSFKYNIVTDEVEDTIAEYSYAMMKEDQITGAQKFMEFDLSAMSLEDNSDRPQASILGKMYSGQDSISTQHHAGKSRAPQASTEEILEVTPDELKELQQAMLLHTQTKNKTSERKSTLHIANLDTNTMLKQIRARRAKEIVEVQDTEEDDEAMSQSQSNDSDESEADEEEDDDYQDSKETNEDNEMEEEESSDNTDFNNEEKSTDDETHIQQEANAAIDHDTNSQSNVEGDEPPPPTGEGGKG